MVQKGAVSLQDLDDQIAMANSLELAATSAEAQLFTAHAAIDIV